MNKLLADRRSAPAVGVVAALLATVLATIVFFPEQPAPRGALVFPAVLMTLGVMFVPILRAVSGSAETTNAENFVMLGFIVWLLLDLLQGAYDLRAASNEGLQMALASIGVFAAMVWVGMLGKPWKAPSWLLSVTNQPLEASTINKLIPICFALGMLNFAYAVDFDIPEMFSYIGVSRWEAPWARGALGGWGAFIDQMPYFGYALPALTALLIAKQGLFRPTTFLAIGFSLIMLLFLSQGGGRRLIGVTVGAALLAWLQANPGLKPKNIVIIVVGAIGMAWASQFMLGIRSAGIEAFREGRGEQLDYLHIDDNFLRLAQILDVVPRDHPFVGSGQVVYAAVRPIPRVFWPNKPVDSGFDLARVVGLRGVSLSSTIIAEWYIGWGWIAIVFGGWIHGRLAKATNTLRGEGQDGNPIVFALGVMVLIAGMRSMLDLVVMSYALVAWWGVNRMIQRRSTY